MLKRTDHGVSVDKHSSYVRYRTWNIVLNDSRLILPRRKPV